MAEAFDGRSFLDVKLGETQRLADALDTEIPVALMTSFATDAEVRAHVDEQGLGRAARVLPDGGAALAPRRQPVPRRRREGVALRAGSRRPAWRQFEPRAPLPSSRVAAFVRSWSRTSTTWARGSTRRSSACICSPETPLTVEVVAKGDDTGGAPARVDGRPQLLEAMRFPPELRPGSDPGFQHEHVADLGRSAERSCRPDLARCREERRWSDGRAVRAALPRALGVRLDDVSRCSAPRRRRPLPAGQGAG